MERIQTKAVSGRVPADVVSRLNRAANETALTKSQLVARSVEHYIEENPDRIEAFYPDDSFAAFVEELCG
ncbi:ribbon-helix-helix domain-containing protein [Halovivax gelatinilyticus]|uniref:ribbon-helix-helix domain-containing protein n=1 Tax=Halovivax gelatinilyticus TaxID=2961597 RepID=UPI0020CA392B|nr:ribbon-helix-helix domain-containing protein [Halovivax gelatinilyticus]